ncbi:hypothetical protein LEN26_021174 [Aphanomyces euteiches]|nr:hypothetical protein LEN26_021174 [Aphanomyces euteiches]KAH9123962.1 hypothetical protein AeMF1_005173 [Aphanomyces euteiches]KAH9195294.1 hypothetical protein AeNC1_002707 [Aphanomyces euteiches]
MHPFVEPTTTTPPTSSSSFVSESRHLQASWDSFDENDVAFPSLAFAIGGEYADDDDSTLQAQPGDVEAPMDRFYRLSLPILMTTIPLLISAVTDAV